MTKEEIFTQQYGRAIDASPEMIRSMDEYAKQECIAFANWLHKEDIEPDLTTDEGKENWCYMFPKGKGTESFTTEQLYQLFLTNQSK